MIPGGDDPRADEGLVEAMARAIEKSANGGGDQFRDPWQDWVPEALAALAAARSHGGM